MNPARKPRLFLQQLRKELRARSDQHDGRSRVFVENSYDYHFQQVADGLPECSEVTEEQPILTDIAATQGGNTFRVPGNWHVAGKRKPLEGNAPAQSEWPPALLPFGNGYPHALSNAQHDYRHQAMNECRGVLSPCAFKIQERLMHHDL